MKSVTLVRKNTEGTYDERYAHVSGMDGQVLLVQWKSEMLHQFARTTGECVESPGGVMRGWRVDPKQIAEFKPADGAGPCPPDSNPMHAFGQGRGD